MKILMINHFPLEGSGSGIYTQNIAKELFERGHEISIVFPEIQSVEYKWFKSVPIIFKGSSNQENYDLPFNFPCFTSHPRSNYTYYDMDQERIDQYINAFIEKVKAEIEIFKPDVIHAQHLWIAPYIASMTNIPYVVTAHGTDIKGFRQDDRYHKYALEGAKKAFKIITISKQVDTDVKNLYGVEAERRQMITNGYDDELFIQFEKVDKYKVLKEFDIEEEPKHIVSFVGKLTHFKGVDVLLKAAHLYEDKYGHSVLTLIAGNGELFKELNDLKKELNLQNVHFLGHVSQKELVKIYNIADVNVVPSRSEPFGLVAVEALACGVPVVGTNQGGLPDFINKKVGALVEVEDELELSRCIIEEIERTDKVERKNYCHNYAKNNFSWKKSITEVEALYEEVIKSKITR